MPNQPWLKKWNIEKDLSHGGQGITFLVGSVTNDDIGVLKLLNDPKNQKARGRFKIEVTNLEVLSGLTNVPKVLDHNIEKYEDKDIDLYLVMEYINGETLDEFVTKKEKLEFDEAIKLTESLSATVKTAIENDIIHRDIKPKNIIVESKTGTLFVVDYGLSFSSKVDDGLTSINETITNSFLSLPERVMSGTDKRDARSDITYIAGVLYFCLTGVYPNVLTGPNGLPPHRISGQSIAEVISDENLTYKTNSFLDRALQTNLINRFQTIDEFIQRLSAINKIDSAEQYDFMATATRLSQDISATDRKTQIKNFSEKWGVYSDVLSSIVGANQAQLRKLGFEMKLSGLDNNKVIKALNSPPDGEFLNLSTYRLKFNHIVHSEIAFIIDYFVLVKGNEAGFYKIMHQGTALKIVDDMNIYGIADEPPSKDVLKQFERGISLDISRAIEFIARNIKDSDQPN